MNQTYKAINLQYAVPPSLPSWGDLEGWSVDPLQFKYPHYTPYQYAGNKPITYIDLDGGEEKDTNYDYRNFQKQQMDNMLRAPLYSIDLEYNIKKSNALDAIKQFGNNNDSTTVWSNISKQDFITSLEEIIQNPTLIDQADTGLCGIAVACKAAIQNNPEKFVEMALSIYQTGNYGDFKANPDLLTKKPSAGLSPSLFVIMTTIRNSQNIFLQYNPENGIGVRDFTYPKDIDEILVNNMNMQKMTNVDWNSSPTNGPELLQGLVKSLNANHFVILGINYNQFTGNNGFNFYPDHYIQITGITQLKNGQIQVNWWSWGKNQKPIIMSSDQLFKSTFLYGSFK